MPDMDDAQGVGIVPGDLLRISRVIHVIFQFLSTDLSLASFHIQIHR